MIALLPVLLGSAGIAAASESSCLSLRYILPFDRNLNFSLDYEEFFRMSQWRFGELDANQDAYLSLDEMPPGKIHESLAIEEGETSFDWDRFSIGLPAFFAFIDSSGDGRLTIPEYRALCRNGWAF